MTLDNLKYALYLNNLQIIEIINALETSLSTAMNTDIGDIEDTIASIQSSINDINNTTIVGINETITLMQEDISALDQEIDTNNTTATEAINTINMNYGLLQAAIAERTTLVDQTIAAIQQSATTHYDDTVIHVTAEDKTLWNSILESANTYSQTLFNGLTSFTVNIVTELPVEPVSMVIYFVPSSNGDSEDYYDEYMYINDSWELIGSTYVNLEPYVLQTDLDTTLSNYLTTTDYNQSIANYTTTEDLSNDYALKTDLHSHDNKSTLDLLSVNEDNNLLYNGIEINSQISTDENNAIVLNANGIYSEDKTEIINTINTKINNVMNNQEYTNKDLDYFFATTASDFAGSTVYVSTNILDYLTLTKTNIETVNGYVTLKQGRTYEVTAVATFVNPELNQNTYIEIIDSDSNSYGSPGLFINNISDASTTLISSSEAIAVISPKSDIYIGFSVSDLELTETSQTEWSLHTSSISFSVNEIDRQTQIDPLKYVNSEYGIEDTPVGQIISFLGVEVPDHYLACDGTVYNILEYPILAEHFSNNFGTSNCFGGDNITTFAVPSLTASLENTVFCIKFEPTYFLRVQTDPIDIDMELEILNTLEELQEGLGMGQLISETLNMLDSEAIITDTGILTMIDETVAILNSEESIVIDSEIQDAINESINELG